MNRRNEDACLYRCIVPYMKNIYIYGLISKLLNIKPYTSPKFKDGAKINHDLIVEICFLHPSYIDYKTIT